MVNRVSEPHDQLPSAAAQPAIAGHAALGAAPDGPSRGIAAAALLSRVPCSPSEP